jgi:hypothetical protein
MLDRRVIGSEMEYGIMVAYNPQVDDRWDNIIATSGGSRPTELLTPESARVGSLLRHYMPNTIADLDPSLDPRIFRVSTMLANGARLYADGGHPEYSTPEVTSPQDIISYEAAGDRLLVGYLEKAKQQGLLHHYHLTRAIADQFGNTWARHRNVEVERATFNPHPEFSGPGGAHHRKFQIAGSYQLASTIYSGEGGLWRTKAGLLFVLSPKMMGVICDFHSDTISNKPVINQRDMPLADKETRARWHITSGSSSLSPLSRRLQHGADMLMADAMELGLEPDKDITFPEGDMYIAARTINTDPTCKATVRLADQSTITAVDINYELLGMFHKLREHKNMTDDDEFTITMLDTVLGQLAIDPSRAMRTVEWPVKLQKMKQHRLNELAHRGGGRRIRMDEEAWRIEQAWARVHAGKTYGEALTKQLWREWAASPEAIDRATVHAPSNTRAHLREKFIRACHEVDAGADWDFVRITERTDNDGYIHHRATLLDTLQTHHLGLDALISQFTADPSDSVMQDDVL